MFLDRLEPHPAYVEWWYINGHLRDNEGKQYSFLECLFKANPRLSNLPIFKSLPLKNYYSVHSFLHADDNSIVDKSLNYFVQLSTDSLIKTAPWNIVYHTLAHRHYGALQLKPNGALTVSNQWFSLELLSTKPPLDLSAQPGELAKWSFTNLAITGQLLTQPSAISVTGKAWLDHHWTLTHLEEIGWYWFSLQLDNNTEVMIVRYQAGGQTVTLASQCDSLGRQSETATVSFKPLAADWTSPRTDEHYTLVWQITLPDWQQTYTITPIHLDQELTFGRIHYWEGPCRIVGQQQGNTVTGRGFLEITHPTSLHLLNRIFNDK